jgi:hypothetical protein
MTKLPRFRCDSYEIRGAGGPIQLGSVHLMPFDSGGLYYPENHAMNSLKHVLQMEGNGTRGAGTIEWRGVFRFSPSFGVLWAALCIFQHSTHPSS